MTRKLIIDRQSAINILIADYKYYWVEFYNIDVRDRNDNYFHTLTDQELIDSLLLVLNTQTNFILEIEIVEEDT